MPEEMGLTPEDLAISPEKLRRQEDFKEEEPEERRESRETGERKAAFEAGLFPGRFGGNVLREVSRDPISPDPYSRISGVYYTPFNKEGEKYEKHGQKILNRIGELERKPSRTASEETEYQDTKGYLDIDSKYVGMLDDFSERMRKLVALWSMPEMSRDGSEQKSGVYSRKEIERIFNSPHTSLSQENLDRFFDLLLLPDDTDSRFAHGRAQIKTERFLRYMPSRGEGLRQTATAVIRGVEQFGSLNKGYETEGVSRTKERELERYRRALEILWRFTPKKDKHREQEAAVVLRREILAVEDEMKRREERAKETFEERRERGDF